MGVTTGEVWSDLDCRLVSDSKGDLKKVLNVESVMGSIDNILRTSFCERCMLPEYGSGLKSLLFENMNETMMNFLSHEMKEAIERWEDRVSITEIQFYSDPDANTISVKIMFAIRGQDKIYAYATSIKGEI